jgi:cobalt/nickel transport protein
MKRFMLVMLALSFVIAGGVSWFASNHPDGLERIAIDLGFMDRAAAPSRSVMPDYTVPGLRGFLSNGLAGMLGVAVTFTAVTVIVEIVRRRKRPPELDDARHSRRR